MKRTTILIGIALFLLAMSCTLFEPRGEPEFMGSNEHEVIMAVIDSVMSHYDSVYVYDQTGEANTGDVRCIMNREGIVRDLTLLSNYNNANQMISYFDVELLADKITLKERDSSSAFSGSMVFTCPGISSNGNWAVVEFSRVSAPLSGGGYVVLLNKQDDEWQIVWLDMIWWS